MYVKRGDNIRCYTAQTEAESILCTHPYFIVCSKGIIVNLHEVKNKTTDSFILTDGTILPISRRKAKDVQKAYAEFHFEKLRKEANF